MSILDMLGYKEMKLPSSSQETAPFGNLLDLSRPWGSLGRIYEERYDAGWITSNGRGDELLVVLRDGIEI